MTFDPTVLEAASWRLASELVRRHPHALRVLRTHPGGGQYDCLTVTSRSPVGQGSIELNRLGSIHVHTRFDGRGEAAWEPVTWDEYLASDPRVFLDRLETASGLRPPRRVPSAVPRTLTYRVLAAIAATAFLSVRPVEIDQGYTDTSGSGGGANRHLDEFAAIPPDLLRTRPDDPFDHSGYRFWIVMRNGAPVLALEEESAQAWAPYRSESFDVMAAHRGNRRNVVLTAADLLRFVDVVEPGIDDVHTTGEGSG